MLSTENILHFIAYGYLSQSTRLNNKMTTKISDGIAKGLGDTPPSDYYFSAHTSEGKLYFVSRKGVNQPKYSFFHRTTLLGGFVSCLNLADNTWSAPVQFDEIDNDENREDLIFAIGGNLYNLVYSRYDGFQYRKCLVWKNDKWEEIEMEIDAATTLSTGHRFHLSQPAIVEEEQAVYLVASGEDNGVVDVSKLKFGEKVYLESVGTAVVNKPPGWCIFAHVQQGWLYCLMGSQGCGFRWEPDRLVVGSLFDFKGTIKTVHTAGDTKPPWAFGGARKAVRLGSNHHARWVFVGGSVAEGMTQTRPNDEIWQIKFDPRGETPEWEKLETIIPEPLNDEGACYTSDNISKLYIADNENAVYQVQL